MRTDKDGDTALVVDAPGTCWEGITFHPRETAVRLADYLITLPSVRALAVVARERLEELRRSA